MGIALRVSLAAMVAALIVASSGLAGIAGAAPPGPGQAQVDTSIQHDVSPAVGDLPSKPLTPQPAEKPRRPFRVHGPNHQPDSALQSSATGPLVGTTTGLGFAGVGNGDYGFVPNAAPPDTNGAVGATQYVQWVNESFAVFDKTTGAIAAGFPKAGNTLWTGFGGACETNNDGDPIVQYDKAANRWILTQFSVSTTPYLQCVAVSTTSDATGTYNRYAFSYGPTQFPDYPKLAVWPDAYYITFNIFNNGVTFAGPKACAYDRSAMLAGAATATQVCFQLGPSFGALLPSDLDGATPPPAGSPNYLLDFALNSLNLWKFQVNFAAPASSTLTGPTSIPVAAFSEACGGGTCIPQPGTNQQLDSLGDRLMYRLAYRNFGDHEALVANHSVTAGTSVGVRWYELRSPGGAPSVFQQGTYAPDATARWMGSIAMDQAGNIAVGYSVSSATLAPGIRYTGRVPTDPPGTLEPENSVIAGGGSQLANLSRWGDYSSMTVDPVDDCTFFYTNEYLKASGTFNWSTRINSFRFPSCAPPPPSTAPTVGSVAPSSGPTAGGTSVTITGTNFSGATAVSFGATAAAAFTVNSATQITATSPAEAAGTVDVQVTTPNGTSAVSAGDQFTYVAPPAAPTVTGLTPTSGSTAGGTSVTISGTSFTGATSVSFGAVAATAFTVNSATQITATSPAQAAGTVDVTVTTPNGTSTASAADHFTYVAPPTATFSMSANPATQNLGAGGSTSYRLTLTTSDGYNSPVNLTATNLPAGVTASFSPNPVTPAAGGTRSDVRVTTSPSTPRGTYTVTFVGTGTDPAATTRTASVTLTVR